MSLHIVAAMLGVVGALVSLFLLTVWFSGERLPRVDQAQWDAAQQRWNDAVIDDYRLVVRVDGPRVAVYQVEVRGGVAVAATRDGAPLAQPRVWETWSVAGMLDTIAIDLEQVARVERGDVEPYTPHLRLYGEFDRENGLPRRYRRVMTGMGQEKPWAARVANSADQGGTIGSSVSWEVLEFEPLAK